MTGQATIEPELRAFLTAVSDHVARQAVTIGDLDGMRRASASARMLWQGGGPQTTTETVDNLGMPARLYRPDTTRPAPLLVYLHGGGWVMLGAGTHDRLLREYATASGWAVLALDYPLAPEAPFPGALMTIGTGLEALRGRANALGLDFGRMVLAGDSRGANLAIAAAMKFPKLGLRGLLLNYGVFDCDTTRPSYRRHADPPHLLTAEKMQFFWANYCSDAETRFTHLASPLRASDMQLSKLPPTCMVIAEQDVLADENEAMAARLDRLGVSISVLRCAAATHAFMEAIAVSPLARATLDASVRWLRQLGEEVEPTADRATYAGMPSSGGTAGAKSI